MSSNTKTCYQGHILANYKRKDGKCGGCHDLRQKRYRATPVGRARYLAWEEKRRGKAERIYYNIKWNLKASINAKKQKIAELERIIS